MNIDVKILNKNTSKLNPKTHEEDHKSLSSAIYPRDARNPQYTQINQCDTYTMLTN